MGDRLQPQSEQRWPKRGVMHECHVLRGGRRQRKYNGYRDLEWYRMVARLKPERVERRKLPERSALHDYEFLRSGGTPRILCARRDSAPYLPSLHRDVE